MTNIINVDFKNNKKISEHTVIEYVDSLTGMTKVFDSSKETKENMVVYLPLFLPAMKGYVQKELAFDAKILLEYLEEIKQIVEKDDD